MVSNKGTKMYYNYYQTTQYEYDECVSKGICSVNPTLTSLQEVILLHLRELAFYLLKLRELGVNNEKIKSDIIDALSGLICGADYSQEEFHEIISHLYSHIDQARNIYTDLCSRHNLECEMLKIYFKHTKKFSLSDLIKRGEKYIQKKSAILTEEQKNLLDIMLFLIKSIGIKYVELKSLGKDNEEVCLVTLLMLNDMNFPSRTTQEIKKDILHYVGIYYELVKQVFWTQVEVYGEGSLVDVSFSTRPGKAILISGSDLKELELVLEAAKKRGVDVYTHGIEMLMAHTYPKFRAYKNLVGHYGTEIDNCLLDFATFPGAILMTRHSLQKIEYLYRGRLFTTDLIAPRGVVKLQHNNLEPLIHSALEAKGFSKAVQKSSQKVGFDEKAVMKRINQVLDKMDKGEIKHLYVIGLLNHTCNQKQYFEKFFKLVPDDSFILSLALDKEGPNILHVDSFYEYSLIYKIFKAMNERRPLSEYKISIFLTKCDKNTIANVLNFKHMGITDIYLCKCSPALVNPSLIKAMINIFEINEFSKPEEDIKKTMEAFNG